eukprot:Gregarina_sp_Pseudo_9__1446@NODE_1970_length_1227_cov_38_804714_g1824_i0_p1_GENE_NODE_1970_length_1227_cov_38_804714_g1824_i0NODE_1970_length_1227_cov_38_804714_g1824_i0_p1_ORF_typecomplete_len265_score32_36_NODE_1970_length_1227_cov_38_804714_g1824_i04311225
MGDDCCGPHKIDQHSIKSHKKKNHQLGISPKMWLILAVSVIAFCCDAAGTFNNLVSLTDQEECKYFLCERDPGADVPQAPLEVCLEETPETCMFEVTFVNSGSTTKVCATGLGFSLEDIKSPIGSPTAWTQNHSPALSIKQAEEIPSCTGYSVYAANSCDDDISAATPVARVESLDFLLSDLLPDLELPAYVLLSSENACNSQPAVSVDYTDVAFTLSVSGRKGPVDDPTTEPGTRQPDDSFGTFSNSWNNLAALLALPVLVFH